MAWEGGSVAHHHFAVRNDGGHGVYFPDPDGHGLEVITRPFGSGTWRVRADSVRAVELP